MITFCGAPAGLVLNKISYFKSITFNGQVVDHIKVDSEIVAEGGYIPELQALYDAGCYEVYNVYDAHPQILKVLKHGAFLQFDGASAFALDVVPAYTDTITTQFLLTVTDTLTKTLWASRDMAHSGKDSFSTFLIKNGLRSDFGDKIGPSNPFNFSLNSNTFYEYTQKAGKTILNGTEKDNLVDVTTFTPTQRISLGASATNNSVTSFSNFLANTWYNTFSVLKDDGMYRCFIVPYDDDLMIDLVTGNTYNNRGTGTAMFVQSA